MSTRGYGLSKKTRIGREKRGGKDLETVGGERLGPGANKKEIKGDWVEMNLPETQGAYEELGLSG